MSHSGSRLCAVGSVLGKTTRGSVPSRHSRSIDPRMTFSRAFSRAPRPASNARRSRAASTAAASSSASDRRINVRDSARDSVSGSPSSGVWAEWAKPRRIVRSSSRARDSAPPLDSASARRLACASVTRTSLSIASSRDGATYLGSPGTRSRCIPHGTECASYPSKGGFPRSARSGRYSHGATGSASRATSRSESPGERSSGSSGGSAISSTAAQRSESSSSIIRARGGGAGGGNAPGSPAPRTTSAPHPTTPGIFPGAPASTNEACIVLSADHLSPPPDDDFFPRGSSSSSSK
mmetsp:Transcript_14851/g.60707  ORF Transcript_14851/g.60707 Transcript_14851/m.60707 type:complete len:294 (-) Transcript_14851:1007-1888(-)